MARGTTLSLDDRSLEQFTTVTATPVHIVATTPAPDRLHATISITLDGDFTLQAASVVNTETTTIHAGATLRARLVDPI